MGGETTAAHLADRVAHVPSTFEFLRDEGLVQRQANRPVAEPVVHCVVQWVAPRLERCARRRAYILHVVVVEDAPLRRQVVDGRRADLVRAEPDIIPPKVVADDERNVGLADRLGCRQRR